MKGRKADLSKKACPIARSLSVIGDWWSLLIIRDALAGTCRFGEFQKNLGLAKNILSARLRKLQETGLLEKVPASDGSKFSDYLLTDKGRQLYLVLAALWQWGAKHTGAPGQRTLELVDRKSGQGLPPLELLSRDGRRLGPQDLVSRLG